jgi:hypothetical protein
MSAEIPLKDVEDGKIVKRRLPTATLARELVDSIRTANREMLALHAVIKDMFDGNRPYNSAKLRAAGQSNRTNVNFLVAKSICDAALAPYYDLLKAVPYEGAIVLDAGTGSAEKSQTAIEEFHQLIASDRDYNFGQWAVLTDYVRFGRAFPGWADEWYFSPRHWPEHLVLFPDGVRLTIEELEVFVVRQQVNTSTLYRWALKYPEESRKRGWDTKRVLEAIKQAKPYDPANADDAVALQAGYKDKDLAGYGRQKTVDLAHVYVKEFSEKWSHLIITEDQVPIEFLFEGFDRYDYVQQIMAPFIFQSLDDTWKGASGLGRDILPICQLGDRSRCNRVDNADMRGSIVMQATTAAASQKIGLVRIGPLTVLPPGYQVQQAAILGDIEGQMLVAKDLDDVLEKQTGIYRPALQQGGGNPPTATQYTAMFSQAQQLTSSAVGRFYLQYDGMLEEMYRRAVNTPKGLLSFPRYAGVSEFLRRCEERGVTRAELQKYVSVQAYRATGNGSPIMRLSSLLALLTPAIAQRLPAEGYMRLIDDVIAASTNPANIARYNPPPDEQTGAQEQVRLATLENVAFKSGVQVPIADTDDHVAHAQAHLADAAQTAASVQQGANPMAVVRQLDATGPHTAEHIKRLAGDKTRPGAARVLGEQWGQMAKVTEVLKKRIAEQAQQAQEGQQKMAQAQAIQQGQDPDIQIKAAKTAATIKLAQQKTAAQLAMKREKHDAEMATLGEKHAQDMALADAKTATGIRLKKATQAALPTKE